MNIALSILSAAASAEAAGTAEAYSGPWENVYNAVHSTAEAVTEEAQGVVDRIQGLGDAHAQLADPDYWGSVGIITLTGILVVFFILAILIFLFWALGKTFQTIDKNRAAKAEAAKKAAAPAPAAAPATVEEIVEEDDNDDNGCYQCGYRCLRRGRGNFLHYPRRKEARQESALRVEPCRNRREYAPVLRTDRKEN